MTRQQRRYEERQAKKHGLSHSEWQKQQGIANATVMMGAISGNPHMQAILDESEPSVNIAGVDILMPTPDSDGKMAYQHPIRPQQAGVYTFSDQKVAGVVEYLCGMMLMGANPANAPVGRKLMNWLMHTDAKAYFWLCN